MIRGGDDLEDDFVIDDIVAFSEGEGEAVESDVAPIVPDPPEDGLMNAQLKEKKRKRRQKDKERKRRKMAHVESIEPQSIAAQPPNALSDYLSSMQSKTFSSLSAIELDDMRIPESSIADTSIWDGQRTLDQLTDFIIKVLPSLRIRLAQRSKHTGSPTLLFVTSAALRVADVTRVLKDSRLRGDKGGDVAKLFARHFKLSEHVTYLQRTKVGAAVGTPGRVGKLLCETDALAVSALTHIILDVTYQDTKKRSLFDIPETRDEVFKTILGAPKVLEAIKQGKIQIVFF